MKRIRSELTQADVEALVATCNPRAKTGARDRALILFLRMTGCRVSEALAVRPCDVDRASMRIMIPGTKTDAARRVVSLPAALEGELDVWLEARRAALGPTLSRRATLFPALSGNAAGAPLTRHKVDRMLKRRAERAGITKRVHAHAFRHGLAADLVRAGAPVAGIMSQLGHADMRVTTRYIGELAASQAASDAICNLFDA